MASLIILLIAVILFCLLLVILLYISIKRRYNEKHFNDDFSEDEVEVVDDEIEVVYLSVDGKSYVFESNGHFLISGESVRIKFNNDIIEAIVVMGNIFEPVSNFIEMPPKLELEESINNTAQEDVEIVFADDKENQFEENYEVITSGDLEEQIPKKKSSNGEI